MVRIQIIYKFVVNNFSNLSQRGRQFQIHIDIFWRARLARYWSMGKIYRHVNQRPEAEVGGVVLQSVLPKPQPTSWEELWIGFDTV